MKPIGQLDTTHAMYQPAKRAKQKCAPLFVSGIPPQTDPRANGTQAEREAWMRERQQAKYERKQVKRALMMVEETGPDIARENLRTAEIERQREAQLIGEAESEVRRRRAREGVK
jgi:hypothetical protein